MRGCEAGFEACIGARVAEASSGRSSDGPLLATGLSGRSAVANCCRYPIIQHVPAPLIAAIPLIPRSVSEPHIHLWQETQHGFAHHFGMATLCRQGGS